MIAVDQDPLLKPGTRVEQGVYSDIYAKPLADGSIAVALWNKVSYPLDITLKVSPPYDGIHHPPPTQNG